MRRDVLRLKELLTLNVSNIACFCGLTSFVAVS